MKTRPEDFSENGLFTMSRLGPEELTHEALEDYLAKGRRLHSAYACGLFVRLWRLLGAVIFEPARWISSTLNSRRAALAERIHGFFREQSGDVHSRGRQEKWDQTRSCRPAANASVRN
jgi:hypothetical protein